MLADLEIATCDPDESYGLVCSIAARDAEQAAERDEVRYEEPGSTGTYERHLRDAGRGHLL